MHKSTYITHTYDIYASDLRHFPDLSLLDIANLCTSVTDDMHGFLCAVCADYMPIIVVLMHYCVVGCAPRLSYADISGLKYI